MKTIQNMTAPADQSEIGDADERIHESSVFAAFDGANEGIPGDPGRELAEPQRRRLHRADLK